MQQGQINWRVTQYACVVQFCALPNAALQSDGEYIESISELQHFLPSIRRIGLMPGPPGLGIEIIVSFHKSAS